ncbi:LytTR family DNA-binding domain-containing protein [Aquincola sp. MAHUQ-54]|uniref:LytTR family DNA-binding domain-containing protein n=1 Tax=Aquincola agrisoli TaxID=3119538 RepID=A0AAW9QNQ1_9BURK
MSTQPLATALIAEDEPLIAAALRADLQKAWPALQVVAQVGDGLSAVSQALALRPRVCFLDIRMPGLDGLQAAQALAEDWPDGVPFPLLVFVTAYDRYALQAFEREAVDYLLKPVDSPRLAQCVERLQRRLGSHAAAGAATAQAPGDAGLEAALAQLRGLLAQSTPSAASPLPRLEVIQAGVGAMLHMVPVEEVLYFEAADKYLRVVTADKEHLIRLSLRELLPQLDPQRFWQVHRGLVVQARCIATAQREPSGKVMLTLRGRPETLAASRLYAHLFKGM